MRAQIGLLVLALTAVACGGSDSTQTTTPPPPTSNKTYDVVTIATSFSPFSVAIAQGDTVRWSFSKAADGLGHNVRFSPTTAGQPADIAIQTTGSVTRVFGTKGTFGYVCDVHPGMIGQVVVQ